MEQGTDNPNLGSFDCTAAVTHRVEIYLPASGEAPVRLDGVTFVCDTHRDAMLEVASWDTGGGYTTHVVKLPEGIERKCGTGFDFTTMRPTAPEVLGEDHPIVETAVQALTFGHSIPVEEISRHRAGLLLDCWAHRGELSDREVQAVLHRFPEVAAPDEATDEQVIEAFRVGREVGKRGAEETLREDAELLARIDSRLTELKELKARHSYTPSRIEGTVDDWCWTCSCGEQFIQLEGERIHATLNAHAKGQS